MTTLVFENLTREDLRLVGAAFRDKSEQCRMAHVKRHTDEDVALTRFLFLQSLADAVGKAYDTYPKPVLRHEHDTEPKT